MTFRGMHAAICAVVLASTSCKSGTAKSTVVPQPPPPPAITSVVPNLVTRNAAFTFLITGTGFGGTTVSQDQAPTLVIERTRDLDGNPVPGPSQSGRVAVRAQGGVEQVAI